jgi:hypothetical protein
MYRKRNEHLRHDELLEDHENEAVDSFGQRKHTEKIPC